MLNLIEQTHEPAPGFCAGNLPIEKVFLVGLQQLGQIRVLMVWGTKRGACFY